MTAPGKPPALTTTSHPIAVTVCGMTIFFPGHEHDYDGENGANAYKRDRDNQAILLGKIEFRYGQKTATATNWGDRLVEGCRVPEAETVYVADQYGVLSPTSTTPRPSSSIISGRWRRPTGPSTTPRARQKPPLFDLKLLLRGMNDQDFPKATLALLRDDDYLTANFATQFQTSDREMYKSNPMAFNNFSTMTLDSTYQHEVGHAFGLDDEYAQRGGLADCDNHSYDGLHSGDYKMCERRPPGPDHLPLHRRVPLRHQAERVPDRSGLQEGGIVRRGTRPRLELLPADQGRRRRLRARRRRPPVPERAVRDGALLYDRLHRHGRDLLHRRRLQQGQVQRRGRLARGLRLHWRTRTAD